MSQLQVKDLKNLTLQDVGRTLSDGQSVQGQVRNTKKGLANAPGLPAISVDFRLIYRLQESSTSSIWDPGPNPR